MKKAILIMLITLFTIISISIIKQKHSKPLEIVIYESYIVQPGDRLETIAKQYPHKHLGKFIYEIEQASNTTALIHPGQELLIPLEAEK